jgi:hypothetical protein
MATINPFYRFEDAPEVASMGQGALRISNATDLLYYYIDASYSGQLVGDVIATINSAIQLWNLNYNAHFVCERIGFNSPLSFPFSGQLYVYDTNVVTQYPLMRISVVFEYDTSGIIIFSKVSFLGVLNQYYNYADTLLGLERDAYRALVSNYESGSALFPKGYSFDAVTGKATSYIARYKDCEYDATLGYPVRVPLDTLPRGSSPKIDLQPLDGDGLYIVSLYEQLIVLAATTGVVYADLFNLYQSWSFPDGYATSYLESTSGGQRLQINIFKAGGSGYTLILREETHFMFQRFYAPFYADVNFLVDFDGFTDLPYEAPDYKVRFYNAFYDYDLCDFQECVYPPKEIYPMPIKAGDFIQFNVLGASANILEDTAVSVGAFDTGGNLIRKIGATELVSYQCACEPCALLLTYSISQNEPFWADYLAEINQFYNGEFGVSLNFAVLDNDDNIIISGGLSFAPTNFIGTQDVRDTANSVGLDFDLNPDTQEYVWSYTVANAICEKTYRIVNTITLQSEPSQIVPIWESEPSTCPDAPFVFGTQQQATAIFPSLSNGCYRLGLLRKDSALGGLESQFEPQTLEPNLNYYLAIVSGTGFVNYLVAIPNWITNFTPLAIWLQNNLPFGTVSVDAFNNITIRLYPYLDLISNSYSIQIGLYDYGSGAFTSLSLFADTLDPTGTENIDELYSLSNNLDLDNSDCFSTLVQFWSVDNSIAEGFEYYNNWFQQVRLGINGGGKKPVIIESVYRQSNGIHKRPQNKQDLSIDLHTDFLDFETQSALVDATRHSFFVVDGQSLFVNGDVEVATIQDFTTQSSFEDLAQVKFSALVQGYQPKNSTCLNC